VIIKVLGLYKLNHRLKVHVPIRECMVLHSDGFSLPFLMGQLRVIKKCCGAGGVIKTFDSLVYRWHLNSGEGTNTKAELLGIWVTLTLASHLSLPKSKILEIPE
jgi:hypothetical protein